MTTRPKRPPKATRQHGAALVTVDVVEPHAVYFDGEQRTGTIEDVPAEPAADWQRHGWATPTVSKEPPAET